MNTANNFAEYWLAQSVHESSPVIQNAYQHTLDWLRTNPHTTGFDDRGSKPDLDDSTPFGIAKHFFWYFETHFFKAQKSLIQAVLETSKYHNAAWLKQPYLCVLDIGCGTGAATCALFDLLIAYHNFCMDQGLSIGETLVSIAAVDPCRFALETFQHITQYLKPELATMGIQFSVFLVEDEFPLPSCVIKLLQNWKPIYPYTLLGISSNVIRPMQLFQEKLRSLLTASGITQEFSMGKLIADAYDQIIDQHSFKQVVIQDIATRNNLRKGLNLFDALKNLSDLIRRVFRSKPKFQWYSLELEQAVVFNNSPFSYHGRSTHDQQIVESVFLLELHTGIVNENYLDPFWVKVTSPDNLRLAWVRARNYILHEDLADEIEIRLADVSWDEYLQRLKLYLDVGDFSVISHNYLLPYPFPKNEEEDRPKYSLRLNEQLICAAVSQAMPEAFQPVDGDRILGNRLNHDENEFFYEPWFKHFKGYSEAVKIAAYEGSTVAKSDLRSFYTNIRQNELYKILCANESVHSDIKAREVLRLVLLRQLVNPPHNQNLGLPQSGITAGLWSSTFLKDVDRVVLDKFRDRCSYYRYADDMAIITIEDVDTALTVIQAELDRLGLVFNQKKTLKLQASKYIERFRDDPRLASLSKKVRRILDGLYFLPAQYKNYYSMDRGKFLETYISLLDGLHVHLSVDWLNRKIISRRTTVHRIQHFLWGMNVNFPALPSDEQASDIWHRKFEHLNNEWLTSRDEAITELVTLFREASDQLIDQTGIDEVILSKAKRALKFSAYRLAVLGVRPISDLLENILTEEPGLLSPKIMLKALVDDNCVEMVIDLATKWKDRVIPLHKDGHTLESASYLCAAACWALGFFHPQDNILNLLYDVLASDGSTIPEKLMSSEALIRIACPFPERNQTIIKLLDDHQNINVEKNLVLLLNMNNAQEAIDWNTRFKTRASVILGIDTAQQMISKQLNPLSLEEPLVIDNYYSRWYPDLPAELQKADHSYGLFTVQI